MGEKAEVDMVLVPREPSYEQLARMSGRWCCSVEEMAESWAQMLDDLAAPAPASPSLGLDWLRIAKAAGEHGIRYRTNSALEAFLRDIASPSPGLREATLQEHIPDAKKKVKPNGYEHLTDEMIDAIRETTNSQADRAGKTQDEVFEAAKEKSHGQ